MQYVNSIPITAFNLATLSCNWSSIWNFNVCCNHTFGLVSALDVSAFGSILAVPGIPILCLALYSFISFPYRSLSFLLISWYTWTGIKEYEMFVNDLIYFSSHNGLHCEDAHRSFFITEFVPWLADHFAELTFTTWIFNLQLGMFLGKEEVVGTSIRFRVSRITVSFLTALSLFRRIDYYCFVTRSCMRRWGWWWCMIQDSFEDFRVHFDSNKVTIVEFAIYCPWYGEIESVSCHQTNTYK